MSDEAHTQHTHTADNIRYYKAGCKVPKDACKAFDNGRFKGTDINRMWRIKTLTEMFGPIGLGWNFRMVEYQERQLPNSDRVVIFGKGELKVKDPATGEWSEPIVGFGGNDIVQSFAKGARINDDAYKMVATDAFGHACSWLGIGADVYWAGENTKYTVEEPKEIPGADVPRDGKIEAITDAIKDNEKLENILTSQLMKYGKSATKYLKASELDETYIMIMDAAPTARTDKAAEMRTKYRTAVKNAIVEDPVRNEPIVREYMKECGVASIDDLNNLRLNLLLEKMGVTL